MQAISRLKQWTQARTHGVRQGFRKPEVLRAIVIWLAVAWLSVACAGYSLALFEFSRMPRWGLTAGSQRIQGAISDLREYGFGSARAYRLRVGPSGDLTIPSELADPDRELATVLREGQNVSVVSTSGKFAVVLELSLEAGAGKQEKLIELDESIRRFGMVRDAATRKAVALLILSLLIPGGVGFLRYRRARRLAAALR